MRETTTGRRIQLVWALAFLALAGNAALAVYNVNVLVANDEQVLRTGAAKEAVADLVSDLLNAETGQRGYQITGRAEYLEPYSAALTSLPERRRVLAEAFAADPELAPAHARLDAAVSAKLAELARCIETHDRDGIDAGRAAVATGEGKRLMDAARAGATELDRAGGARLAERSAVARSKYRVAAASALVGGALGVGVLALAYRLIGRELARRRLAETTARLTAGALAQSQAATAEALAQLDAFLDHAPVGIAFLDPDLRYRRVNRALADSNGLAPEAHLGKSNAELLPDFPDDLVRDFRRVLATRAPVVGRPVVHPRNGSVWEVSLYPVLSGAPGSGAAGGELLGLGVVAQDTTARHRAQEGLRESEERFRTLADAVPQFVWTTRPDGEVEYFNGRWYDYTGLSVEETLGHAWAAALHPDDRARTVEVWARATAEGSGYEIEYRFRSAAGQYRWFIGRARPVRNPATGEIARWFGTCTDIDDAVRAAERLQASESRFRALAEAVPGFVFTLGPAGDIEYITPRAAEFTGVPVGELHADGWAAVVHPDDAPAVAASLAESRAGAREFAVECRLRRSGGELRWFGVRGLPVLAGSGALLRWHGIATDIHDAKSFEARLRQSEARLRTLAETVPGFVWSARPDGSIDYQNSRVSQYSGVPAEDALGEGWVARILYPGDRDRTLAAWLHSVATGEPYQIEYRLRARDGSFRWFVAQAVPARDPSGEIEKWYGTCTDVDDFKELSLRAELNAERFRLLTESIPQLIWNADHRGRLTYANTQCRDYTGLGAASTAGEWLRAALHPAHAPAVEAAWDRLLGDGAAEQLVCEARVRRAADGAYRWFLLSVVPLRRADGTVDQWIASLSDIDDQKQQSARLEQLVRVQTNNLVEANEVLRAEVAERQKAESRERGAAVELRRSNSELEKFAYVASHDLQEPLRKIQAFGERLARTSGPQLGAQGADYLGRMQSSAARMSTLIDDLLSFSRVTTTRAAFGSVDLGAAAREAVQNVEVRLQESGGAVEIGELPQVPGDPTQLRQLFQNLIANALKFRRAGVAPVVTITATPTAELGPAEPPAEAEGLRITVADNGIGFEPQYAERIFEVFQRLHGRGEYEGTGIGLAICRKIAERHGGAIRAQGAPGAGARFLIDLPARPAEQAGGDTE